MTLEPESAEDAREALAEVRQRGCLVELYTDGNDDRFFVGYVDALTISHVRLRSLDCAGRPDGIGVRTLADVSRVETGTDYLVRRIAPLEEAGWRNAFGPQRLVGDDPDLVRDALVLSFEDRTVVTVWPGSRNDVVYTGIVAKLATDAATIVDLDEFGDPSREVPFRIAEIRSLDFGSEHERIARYLAGLTKRD